MMCFESKSQDFEVIPVRKGLNTSNLDKDIKIIKASKVKKITYLSPRKRDEILKKYLLQEVDKLDDSEKDLLYKSIINYDDKTLVEKYHFLKEINLTKLRNDLL